MARDRESGLVLMDEPPAAPLEDFNEVARLHRPAVFRFLLASLRNTDTAETLTQECLLRAYKARESFRGDSGIRTWLMRIAVNLLRDHYTNARLRFWRRVSQSNVDVSVAAQWVADRQATPEAAAAAKQQVDAIWRAAGSLSQKQHTVLLLRFVEDMDLLEIAEATGMKEGTVKAHLFRAIRNVRSELEKKR